MNSEQLERFQAWLQEHSLKADQQYLDAEENSQIEEYWLGASDAFDDALYELQKILAEDTKAARSWQVVDKAISEHKE